MQYTLILLFNLDHVDTIFQEGKNGEGFRLVSHVMYTEDEVPDVFTCMNYCQLYDGCKSFNFSREKKICEMNNATTNAFRKDSSFVFYQKINVLTNKDVL